MEFNGFSSLISEIHRQLGSGFCSNFQYKRKEISGALRTAGRDKLFGNIHEDGDEWWAINEGGGTEVQYHISVSDDEILYGLGFNALTVQFKYEKTPADYIRPFMNAFIKNEAVIMQQLPNYSFVTESRAELLNPQSGRFTLFGKRIPIGWNENNFFLDDALLNQLIQDLRNQLPSYELIFLQKQRDIKIMAHIDEIINLLVNNKPQIILQGPPGTGKTFTAKDVAEKIITKKVSPTKTQQQRVLEEHKEEFKLIQFHPAYSYEDFVRGITAKAYGDGIVYETENRTLAKFARLATENWDDSNRSNPELKKLEWFKSSLTDYALMVEKEILTNRYFLDGSKSYISKVLKGKFAYYSEEYKYHPDDFEITFKELESIFLKTPFDADYNTVQLPAHTQHRKILIPLLRDFRAFVGTIPDFGTSTEKTVLKSFVLIIDEINRANLPAVLGELIYALEYRGEKVTSMYEFEGEYEIVLPPNLYIIGTMNTADRSVGHIDYAIRRRFAFVNILPSDAVINDVVPIANDLRAKSKRLFSKVELLFAPEKLNVDFKKDEVQLGHSYFLADNEEKLKLKLEYEIKPLLREYLKDGILKSVRNTEDKDQTEIDINELKIE